MRKIKVNLKKPNIWLNSWFSLHDELIKAVKKNNSDKKIVLMAVINSWTNLKYASEELKNDKEVVMFAVKSDWNAIAHASDKLKNDKDIILASIKNSYFKKKWAL